MKSPCNTLGQGCGFRLFCHRGILGARNCIIFARDSARQALRISSTDNDNTWCGGRPLRQPILVCEFYHSHRSRSNYNEQLITQVRLIRIKPTQPGALCAQGRENRIRRRKFSIISGSLERFHLLWLIVISVTLIVKHVSLNVRWGYFQTCVRAVTFNFSSRFKFNVRTAIKGGESIYFFPNALRHYTFSLAVPACKVLCDSHTRSLSEYLRVKKTCYSEWGIIVTKNSTFSLSFFHSLLPRCAAAAIKVSNCKVSGWTSAKLKWQIGCCNAISKA